MQKYRLITIVGALAFAAQLSFASTKSSGKSLQFFGTITNVNAEQNNITVHNKKKNADTTFQLSDETRITRNKASISPHELKVGESLAVYYVSENDIARAQRISVRTNNFKKKQTQ